MDTSLDMPTKYLKHVINPWLLGADPEWAVLTPPDVVVPNLEPHAVNTTTSAGQIGSDHNGRVWELRPAPSPSAYVVATNLWKLLSQPELSKVERFKWKSGALGAKKHSQAYHLGHPGTLQGWIQMYSNPVYGFTPQQAQMQATAAHQAQVAHQQALLQAQELAGEATGALDTLGGHVHFGIQSLNPAQRTALNDVTTGLLNLDILPRKENERRLRITAKASPAYGHFNGGDAVRDCNGHVEYRCAPSWLDSPHQALAALTTYKLAAARPSSVKWPTEFDLKASFLDWLEELRGEDVDAHVLMLAFEESGFKSLQADPSSDFKPRWRRANPWERL